MTPYNPPLTYTLPAVPVASHHAPAEKAPAAPAPAANPNKNGPWAYHGKTKAKIDEENRAIAYQNGAYAPAVFVPKEAGPGQQYWCRELEGFVSLVFRLSCSSCLSLVLGYVMFGLCFEVCFILSCLRESGC